MNKVCLRSTEITITNVCNFNCIECRSFNNYNFHGVERWKDYEKIYTKWAEKIDIDYWEILGGEPMTNPDYIKWIDGFCRLWPNS